MGRIKNALSVVIALLLVGVCLASAASADTIAFREGDSPDSGYAHQATYVFDNVSGGTDYSVTPQNNSGSQSLVVSGNDQFFKKSNTLLEFDISAIPAGATIDSVELVLHLQNGDFHGKSNSIPVDVHTLGDAFDETTAAWDTLTPAGGDTTGALLASQTFDPTPVTDGTPVTWGSTSAFQGAAQNALDSDGLLRLILTSTTTDDGFARFYYEESDALVSMRPSLTINYTVPEPASLALAVCGAAMIGLRRARPL